MFQRKEGHVHRKEEWQGAFMGLPAGQVSRVKTEIQGASGELST